MFRTDTGLCTHGPDASPKDVDVKKDTPPAVKAKYPPQKPGLPRKRVNPSETGLSSVSPSSLDASAPSAASRPPSNTDGSRAGSFLGPAGQTVQCDGDGSTGNRVQVVYVHAPGNDRYATYAASFRKWAADADLIFSESAKDTGGVRHIRYVTSSDCLPTVLNIELTSSELSEFSAMHRALAERGLDRRDRKYMIFADAQVYCGIGTFAGDERPAQDNLSNFGPSYGRTDTGCWGGHTAAHELGHNLGAVNNSAPNTSRGAHCTDEWDVMCYSDSPYYPRMRSICQDGAYESRLDCNHDDYFHTNPRPGSYLATHWNIADSQFLLRNRGTTQPDPTPTPTGTPATGPDVIIGQINSDSAFASWKASGNAAWYRIYLNDKPLGWVTSTNVRLYNLRAETTYTISVSVFDSYGKETQPGRATRFRTAGEGGDSTPSPNYRYMLSNGASGTVAEIYGGQAADGSVLVGSQLNGYKHQQWYFNAVGSGYIQIRSAATGKCLQTGGTAVVGMWVGQQACRDVLAQRWKVTDRGIGLTITSMEDVRYVLGVSNRPYYGSVLIELQLAAQTPAQTWTLQKTS
ncbi:RICIN domain-containing protein [Streptomyces lavendulocolor]|uniref:RICIN domain-containing protein n=1 Tax=Streptomyces lavendulocolor TaxID=67316 RepID=UPI0033D0C6CA